MINYLRILVMIKLRLMRPLACFGLMLAMIATFLFTGCANEKPLETQGHFKLITEIPEGKTTVEVLELRYSDRVEALSQKISRALAANKNWWLEYMKTHIDERPLPYHTNMGISKLEYAEYLEGVDKSRHLQKVSDASLIFKRRGEVLSIDIGAPSSPIEKWRLNLSSGKLSTPRGDVDKPTWKKGDDPTQPLGAYEGYSWQYGKSSADLSNIRTETLWIYRLKPAGMMFWRMEDSVTEDNQIVRSIDLKFRYDPKQLEIPPAHLP
jgi:hypothetical protein